MKLSEFIRYESKGAYYIMASLLEKTRKINRLLQRSEKCRIRWYFSLMLNNVLNANVYITNKERIASTAMPLSTTSNAIS